MNSEAFLRTLRAGLAGLSKQEIEEIIADYEAHFAEARASGRSEAEVVDALGDPARLARELRAETGLRRFESHRSFANLITAMRLFESNQKVLQTQDDRMGKVISELGGTGS